MIDTTSSTVLAPYYSDIETTVKFYDPAKGFGFVEVSDGSPDAYLPSAVVEAAGFSNISSGVVLFCEIVQGSRNPEVVRIHFVDTVTGKVQFLTGRPQPQMVPDASPLHVGPSGGNSGNNSGGKLVRRRPQGAMRPRNHNQPHLS